MPRLDLEGKEVGADESSSLALSAFSILTPGVGGDNTFQSNTYALDADSEGGTLVPGRDSEEEEDELEEVSSGEEDQLYKSRGREAAEEDQLYKPSGGNSSTRDEGRGDCRRDVGLQQSTSVCFLYEHELKQCQTHQRRRRTEMKSNSSTS